MPESEKAFALTDRDLLVRIDTKMEAVSHTLLDHETRLRIMERFQWLTIGVAVAVSTLVTIVSSYLNIFHR